MSKSRGRYTAPGVDAHQARAREAAGIEMPRPPSNRETERQVEGLVLVTCEKCGCSAGKIPNKRTRCAFCGTML